MEPGEYLTNVLSFNNFASINYEYLEPQGLPPGTARKLLTKLEAGWREEGRLVHCDTFRDGIWAFQNASNTSTDSPISKGTSTDTSIVEAQGIRLVLREKGIFEPASLAKSKHTSPNAFHNPNSNSSPSSSSLEANIRNAQLLNSRAMQGNGMPEPMHSPGLKQSNKPDEMWPSMREVHESFISAVLGSLVYFLCRDECLVPLNSRTLILNPTKPLSQGGFASRSLQIANAITLATLDISLTSLGTLVVKAHSDTASGLQSLVEGPGVSIAVVPGAALWLAPGGNAAKFYGTPDDMNLPSSSASQVQASATDSKLNNFSEASMKSWQSKCLEWLSAKGINTAAIDSGGWLYVQVLGGHSPYSKSENQGIPILEGLTVVPWPAVLCFQTSSSGTRDSQPNGKHINGSRDPISFAENWFTGRDERASIMLKRQKERQIAEARSKEQADVEARALQSAIHSPAVLRRASNAGAMYPTPPDAIHHPIGATPTFDGAASTPGNLNPFIQQDNSTIAQTSSGIGTGMADSDPDIWGPSIKKGRAISNALFHDGENDADDAFNDTGVDLFGADITDADFNFFDEPDAVQLEPRIPDAVDFTQIPANISPEESRDVKIFSNMNKMNAPDTVIHEQRGSEEKEDEKAMLFQMELVPSVTNGDISENASNAPATEHVFQPPVQPPFNQEAIYRRLTLGPLAGSQKMAPRRASTFDKVDFERALSSVDKKYTAHGQFNFSSVKKNNRPTDATVLPQTEYLSSRKRIQDKEPPSNTFARIWMDEGVNDKLESHEHMDFLMDSDDMSPTSEQDDTSNTTDDPSFLPKLGLERSWLAENAQGDGITTPFDPMAIDFEQSASTPQSMSGSQIPLLDADPADWSLTTYFTSPEPEVQSNTLTDLDRMATAQILADQAVSGTLQLPRVSGSETPLRSNKANTTRELMRSVTKAAKSYFKDITPCTMRSFLDIQGIPVLNQGLRLPPRPINPRGPNPLDPRSHNPFPIHPPQLEVRRSDSKLSILPPAINFWENLGLSPCKGAKNINAVCVFPNIDGVAASANSFLEQMKSVYESFRMGSHDRVTSKDLIDGLMPFSFDHDQNNGSANASALNQMVGRLCKALSTLPLEETNLVVYFVYPVDNAPLFVNICSSFHALFNMYRKALLDLKRKPFNELVLQLIPLDFISSPTSIVAPLPSEYARLAMEVYDRCMDFSSSSSSPGIMLEQPLPKSIDFRLNATPSASVLQENTCFHIAYAQSIDDRWVTAVWTDNRGTQQMTASYCLGRRNEPITRPFSEIAAEIWDTTLDFISHKKIHWRLMIARVGVMDPSEIDFWTSLASAESNAQVSLTLITVQTDPSLRLLPPAVTLTPNGNNPTQSTTPVSTPQHSIVSPETSTTPVRDVTVATPNEVAEPDIDARLIDYTDQSWGAVLAHRLNNSNSLLELNPALISGYLLKRGGTNSDDPPIVIEVNIVHNPIHIAVIGGTGLQSLPGYTPVAVLNPLTPWGYPSSPIHVLTHNKTPIAFLSRHGLHHQLAPHEVPSQANIAALRSIGVRTVIAFSAVGSLQEEIHPRDFVVPDQVIDRTKGIRPFTFFEKGVVGHVGFADPFDAKIGKVISDCGHSLAGAGVTMHDKGTIICMEGPAFSTRAESHMYRSWGGSIINMSCLPEAKLAREAELSYQMICMATDYDCWHSTEDVDVAMVMGHMAANGENAKRLVGAVLDELSKEQYGDLVKGTHWAGSVEGMLKFMTKEVGRGEVGMKNIEFLYPGVWK
ncbi:S-methyl-5'-thioadenosine phosphorylase [Lachnellula occidentalis]|uniref:S-methyl-5'-thioadenosine phosphorylase n=1 Tax=Lachnellula occidentalis TaxID=215460 RepID=A0A8H8S561_9HELO|nr:S-methyl-5'-thioadenosine phosphorylase [Lachnellula occidentalis]